MVNSLLERLRKREIRLKFDREKLYLSKQENKGFWRVKKFYNMNQNHFLDVENIELKFTRKFESSEISSPILMSSKSPQSSSENLQKWISCFKILLY